MEPTITPGERVEVAVARAYQPQLGDIVVFSDPRDWLLQGGHGHIIKRVLGRPGDHVSCDPTKNGGRLVINGVAVDESSYLPPKKVIAPISAPVTALNMPDTHACQAAFSVLVPARDVWVLGDNRGDSSDSRFHMSEPGCGGVPIKDVLGAVTLVEAVDGRKQSIARPSVFDSVPLLADSQSSRSGHANMSCYSG